MNHQRSAENRPSQPDEDAKAILSRRQFLIASSLAGAGIGVAATGCKPRPETCLSIAPPPDPGPQVCLSVEPDWEPDWEPEPEPDPPGPDGEGPTDPPDNGPQPEPEPPEPNDQQGIESPVGGGQPEPEPELPAPDGQDQTDSPQPDPEPDSPLPDFRPLPQICLTIGR
jgi:hypothetical protein